MTTSTDDPSSSNLPDPKHFFPAITNQNECRALNCLFIVQSEDWESRWEFTNIDCDTKDSDGSNYDSLGPGCYCQSSATQMVLPKKCCFYGNCPEVDVEDFETYKDYYEYMSSGCRSMVSIGTLAGIMASSGGKTYWGKK